MLQKCTEIIKTMVYKDSVCTEVSLWLCFTGLVIYYIEIHTCPEH